MKTTLKKLNHSSPVCKMNEIVTMNLLPYTSYELMIDTTIPRNLISKVDVETVTLI